MAQAYLRELRDNEYRCCFPWSNNLAAEIQPEGDHLLWLITSPWGGALKMLVRENELVFDAAQMKYVFRKER